MWGELLSIISDHACSLESMQQHIAGYVDPNKGWNLNSWFNERGYEFVGLLDLFSENEASGVYVNVHGYVWYCRTNAHDNSLYGYWESNNKGDTLDELRFLHGYAHQFIWDNNTHTFDIVNTAE